MENSLYIHTKMKWKDDWEESDFVISLSSFWEKPSEYTKWIKVGKNPSTDRNYGEGNTLWSEKNIARVNSKNVTTLQTRVQEIGRSLISIYEQIGMWIKKNTLSTQTLTKKTYLDQSKGTLLTAIFSLNAEIQELPNFLLCSALEVKEKEIEPFSILTSITQKDALINCEYFLRCEEEYLKLTETLKKEIFKVQLCLFSMAAHLGKDIELKDNDQKAFYLEHRTTVFSSLFLTDQLHPLYETLERLEDHANEFFNQQKEKT